MMKRKFLAVILPLVGCATLVGSGFSARYFGEATGTSSVSPTINVDVTEEIDDVNHTLSLNTNLGTDFDKGNAKKLLLDQGGAKNNCVDSGITFVNSSSTEQDITKIIFH